MPEATPATPTPAAPVPPAAPPAVPAVPPAAAAPPATPPAAPEPKVSAAFAAITKKERQLQAERATWKAQREKEAAEHAADIASAKRLRELRAEASKDPKKYDEIAKEIGLDYDKWSQVKLNDGETPPDLEVQALRQEIEDLKQGLTKTAEQKEAEAKKAAAAQSEADLVEARGLAAKSVEGMGEKAELVNALGLQNYVVSLVEEHYNKTEEWIAPEVAAETLEKHLQDGGELPDMPFAAAFKRLSETKWFKSRYQPVEAAPAAPAPKAAPVQTTRVVSEKPSEVRAAPAATPPASPTITNRLTTSSSSYPRIDSSKKNSHRDQLRARALATAFPGTAH